MAQVTVQARDIKGLTPAISAVNSDDTFALSGTNYVFDSLGPKSAFGSAVVNDNTIATPRGFQIFRESDKLFAATTEAISLINPLKGTLTPVLIFEPTQTIARWTHGFLNGIIYFCHPGVGILFWNQRNNQRGLLNVPGVPASPIAIVVDNGRLVVIDQFAMTWSAISDGADFTPSIGGAGAQAISDRVSGTPLMVTSYGRGVLTWTTQGVMRSEFAGGVGVYRHRGINTEYRPINSFCVVKLDDETSVILDPRGLFSSKGEPPVPFAPLFNEFLISELQKNDSLSGNNTRLEWDPFSRRIYVSRAFTLMGDLYDQAFVLYAPLQKWGDFSFKHYGYGHGFWLGEDQRLKQFAGTPFMQGLSVDNSGYLYDERRLYPELAQRQRQTVALSSTIRLAHLPESQAEQFTTPTLYTFDGSAITTRTKAPLNSKIVIGFFRLQEGFAADELSQVTDTIIGSVESRELSSSDVDYNVVPAGVSDEDYNLLTGTEDFGLNPLTFVNFQLKLRSTIDGISTFDESIPILSQFFQALRTYSGGANGIWHVVELETVVAGEFFHVRNLQLNAIPSGRLI